AGGASVFPGGAVDPEDRAPALLASVDGVAPADADARLGEAGALGRWVAAIRESFEEAGVLLARDAAAGRPLLGRDRETSRLASLDADRRALLAGERTFTDVVTARAAVLDAGELVPVARWITPAGAPRRYDTWFFVAPAPTGHAYLHDDVEAVASEWVRPGTA